MVSLALIKFMKIQFGHYREKKCFLISYKIDIVLRTKQRDRKKILLQNTLSSMGSLTMRILKKLF